MILNNQEIIMKKKTKSNNNNNNNTISLGLRNKMIHLATILDKWSK